MTERNLVNVFQVEDQKYTRKYCQREIEDLGLTYSGVPDLEGLRLFLESGDAQVYLIDGNFPRKFPGGVELLAGEAVDLIRTVYPQADVVLFSLSNLERLARAKRVDFWNKGDYFPASKLGEELKERIAQQT